jgi:hypothetical protein
MSTHDVPGAVAGHNDVLAMGCWAEHEDGSLILVENTEGGRVVYVIFDVAVQPPVEYRDWMSVASFQLRFSWSKKDAKTKKQPTDIKWTWHDKTGFPWERLLKQFPPGTRDVSAEATLSAAERVARSLDLRAQPLREVMATTPGGARTIMQRIRDAIAAGVG